MKLTENHACAAIMREQMRRSFVIPRYTPRDWWECDVFELTAAGYFREYEVKLTLADFRNDAKKERELYTGWKQPRVLERKHELLARADPRAPSQFFYVTPANLIDPSELPPWAGLIELWDRGEGHRPTWRWGLKPKIKAPKIHTGKADQRIRREALGVCYYRLHAALDALRDRTAAPVAWADDPPPVISDHFADA